MTEPKSRSGGADRVSTKTKLARELVTLGEVLTRAREQRGLKQGEVAARLALPASYLSKIENGTRRLDVIELVQIAEAMEIDPAEIVSALQKALATESTGARTSVRATPSAGVRNPRDG